MSPRHALEDRFVVGIDVQKYSSRNTRRQLGIQRGLDRLLDEAAEAVGLDRKQWARQPGGDGEIAVLPTPVDLVTMVRAFVAELDQLLTDYNEDRAPDTQIRVRLAMHIDAVTPGELGYAGPALVVLSRLLDSAPVRLALVRNADANLALIISEPVYKKAVTAELGGLRPRQFEGVEVDLPDKGFRETAYVFVPTGHPTTGHPTTGHPTTGHPTTGHSSGGTTDGRQHPPANGPSGGPSGDAERSAVFIVSDTVNVGGDLFGGGKRGDSR